MSIISNPTNFAFPGASLPALNIFPLNLAESGFGEAKKRKRYSIGRRNAAVMTETKSTITKIAWTDSVGTLNLQKYLLLDSVVVVHSQ